MADETIPPPTWTVYRITNLMNGKLYFGLTKRGLKYRWAQHIATARDPKSRNFKLLQKAIRKRGPDNFKAEVVAEGLTKEEACTLEKSLIAAFGTLAPNGYNATTGGEDGTPLPEAIERMAAFHRGRKRSAETRARISAKAKGRKQPPEAIEKTAAANRGKKRSKEFRAKQSAIRRGKPRPDCPETVKRQLRTMWLGRHHSDATKMKMRETQKARIAAGHPTLEAARNAWIGQRHSPTAKAKMSAARKGISVPHTAESKAKISAGNRGKIRSPEQRRRISAAAKSRHATRLMAESVVPASALPPEAIPPKALADMETILY